MNSMTSSMEIQVCHQIARDISGEVYYPSDKTGHFFGNSQHALNSSNERSLCVVEVASTEDVSKTITIIGTSRTPFAIQSGGHTSNPGFSSTKGIHISLARLTQIHLSQDKSSVEIGLGNVRQPSMHITNLLHHEIKEILTTNRPGSMCMLL